MHTNYVGYFHFGTGISKRPLFRNVSIGGTPKTFILVELSLMVVSDGYKLNDIVAVAMKRKNRPIVNRMVLFLLSNFNSPF